MLQEVRALEAAGTGVEEQCEGYEYDDEGLLLEAEQTKRMKWAAWSAPSVAVKRAPPPPVEVIELRVSKVGERVPVVSLTCGKGRDAMARVCSAVEELRLRVITASITSVTGCLMHTIFIEAFPRVAAGEPPVPCLLGPAAADLVLERCQRRHQLCPN